jgi:hypothetical protein
MQTGNPGRRVVREKRAIECMISIHCRDMHGTRGEICTDCRDMLDYSFKRLETCKLLPDKPTCARCPVHCFNPAMRHRVRAVMRYAGPRMIFRHPVMTLMHVVDGFNRSCRR